MLLTIVYFISIVLSLTLYAEKNSDF